jgi:hypothetical protein
VLQEPEQHWLFIVQPAPLALHWHAAVVLHPASAQSTLPLQLSSMPLPQISAAPLQSSLQVEQVSALWQMPSPQQ